MSRVFARDAAQKVADEGARWVIGAWTADDGAGATQFETSLGLAAVHAAQAGLVADMDRVADALYGRASSASPT
jgi:hypothetical protein